MNEPQRDAVPRQGAQMTPATADEVKARTAAGRVELTRAQIDLEKRDQELREEQKRMEAKLREQQREMEQRFRAERAALEAQLAPLRAELERLEEVSWTVDLYTGRDEDVTLLVDGRPAPADAPITVRQSVLFADEESLLYAEDNSFDHKDMDTFVQWLTASADNREQMLPDQRGVVVVVPTRQYRDYGDPFANAARRGHNSRAHWLIRNGERFYLMTTDPALEVHDRLLPKRDEFAAHFTHRKTPFGDPEPLTPGTDAWIKAEAEADAKRRHYMRLMLVLQGLVDRTVVFHPLPEGGVNLMSLASQDAGRVVIIDEESMVLTDGRPSFREWQRALNAKLRRGVRVILSAGISEHDYDHGYRNWRLHPANASKPPVGEPLMVEDVNDDGDFVIRYERDDTVYVREWVTTEPGWGYHGEVEREAKTRASARLRPDDDFVLPFDLASRDDLEYHLRQRSVRQKYPRTVPIIRAALAAKTEEYEAEAPLRALLLDTIAQARPDIDRDEVARELEGLVSWWKAGARYARALAGDSETEARAAKAIVAEWRRREAAKVPAAVHSAVVAAGKALPSVLAVAHLRGKRFFAYTVADEAMGPWLHEHELDKDGQVVSVREWTQIAPRRLQALELMWQSDRWEQWPLHFRAGDYLTGPEREQIFDELRAKAASMFGEPMAISAVANDRTFEIVCRRGDAAKVPYDQWVAPALKEHFPRTPSMSPFAAWASVEWKRGRDGSVQTSALRDVSSRRDWERRSDDALGAEVPFVRAGVKSDFIPTLMWESDALAQFVQIQVTHEKVFKEQRERERDEQQALRMAAQEAGIAWAGAIAAAWVEREAARERERFVEDFGTDDPELWEHHLGTLNLRKRLPEGARSRLDQEVARPAFRQLGSLEGRAFDDVYRVASETRTYAPLKGAEVALWSGLVPARQASPEGDEEGADD